MDRELTRSDATLILGIASLAISLCALGVSAWAVRESRETTLGVALEVRRTEVRTALAAYSHYAEAIRTQTSCILHVADADDAAEAPLRKELDTQMRQYEHAYAQTLRQLDSANLAELTGVDQLLHAGTATLRTLEAQTKVFKLLLTPEELQRVREVCS